MSENDDAFDDSASLKNQFLIALPSFDDSIFAKSITYICDHSSEGAMGLIINKPLHISLGDVFEQLELPLQTPSAEKTVLAGGPVNTQQGMVLHRSQGQWASCMQVSHEVCVTASKDILEAMSSGTGPNDAQLVLGYAGWGEGQLEDELNNNCWLTMPANEAIMFDTPVEERWDAAINALGIDINLIPTHSGHA